MYTIIIIDLFSAHR